MELVALVGGSIFLTRAKSSKILGSNGRMIGKKFEDNTTFCEFRITLLANLDIEVSLRVGRVELW